LIAELVSEGVEATVPATIRETVEVAERLLEDSGGDPITVAAIARELKLDNSAALRRVRAAIDRGYLKNLEDHKGRPARIVMGDPLPEDIEVLPQVEALRDCTVAREIEGIGTPLPLFPASMRGSSCERPHPAVGAAPARYLARN
jgi:hypothetical protein